MIELTGSGTMFPFPGQSGNVMSRVDQLSSQNRELRCDAMLCLAVAACALRAQPDASDTAASAAIEFTQPDWNIVHCGVSRGVLYVSYIHHGKAAITPAFTPTVRRACAAAGYMIQAAASRTPLPQTVSQIGMPAIAPMRPTAIEPSFVAQASGRLITIEGRNDGDRAYHCVLNLSFASDTGASPSVTTQVTVPVTVPGRQSHRVFTTGPHLNARAVRLMRHCSPSE